MSFAPVTSQSAVEENGGEYFPGIKKIEYRPDAVVSDVMCFKYYNPQEVVHGRTMEEWLRFSVCYWHTFRGTGADPFGFPTMNRPWDDGSNSMENAKRRLRAAFEFYQKLGNKYWTFHDRDVAPLGKDWAETNVFLDEITDYIAELQKQTGVKLLWTTSNLFAHPGYACGASTNPDAHVFAMAAAQVKKGLEVAKRLGGEGFVFWGGREGYQSLLNTDVKRELDHMAAFFRMAIEYKKKIGFNGQLYIEPKPKEPMKHQYDYDAQTVISFLKTYNLDAHIKLNIEPNHTTLAGHSHEHDVILASKLGMLGSVDANTGSPDLGWDTDQFPMDVKNATFIMKAIIEQGGLIGGLNFDCKVRRESTALEDMFIAHIGAMDTFARALKAAVKIIDDGVIPQAVKQRYASYDSGIGARIESGEATLEELETYILTHGTPVPRSGQQEKFEALLNRYV
eukprot:Em0016g228a